jgi:hypothetical protein
MHSSFATAHLDSATVARCSGPVGKRTRGPANACDAKAEKQRKVTELEVAYVDMWLPEPDPATIADLVRIPDQTPLDNKTKEEGEEDGFGEDPDYRETWPEFFGLPHKQ